jgi:hypothetical protein
MIPLYAVSGAIIITVIGEATLWYLFQRKMKPLAFPHELDTSYFRFFSLPRLMIIAITHTVFVIACLIFFYWYLW